MLLKHRQAVIRAYNPITRRNRRNGTNQLTMYREMLVDIIWIKAINKARSPVHLYRRII
jgi:hypothetical protein